MRFRFTGNESCIGNIRVAQYLQALELDSKTAHDAIIGQVGLITEDEFQTIGFTEEELDKYSHFDSHRNADPTFLEKRRQSHVKASSYRMQYEKDAADGNTFMARANKPAATASTATSSTSTVIKPSAAPTQTASANTVSTTEAKS